MPGAREKSAEQIVVEMRRNGDFISSRTRVWDGEVTIAGRVFGPQAAGSGAPVPTTAATCSATRRERELFPDDAADQARRAKAIGELAAKGLALGKAMGAMRARCAGAVPRRRRRQVVDALRGIYATPWQMALQTWLEGVVPGERTFVRPSRRGADREDVVMPGRRRHAWMLNVVLDTSGSMSEEIPRALGAIADFCDAAAVDDIRLVQCDTAVTSDEVLTPAALAAYEVSGYGGSDLTPAMLALADDPRVTARSSSPTAISPFPPSRCPMRCCGFCRRMASRVSRRPTGAWSRCSGRRAPMKVVQELVNYFDRAGQALAEAAPQAAGAGLPRGRRAGDDARPLRHRRHLLLLPGDRPDRRQPVGHRRLHRRFHDRRRRRPCRPDEALEVAVIKVTVVTPPAQFTGSVRNGVTSHDFGRYGSAYRLADDLRARFPLRNGAKNLILGDDLPARGDRKDFR